MEQHAPTATLAPPPTMPDSTARAVPQAFIASPLPIALEAPTADLFYRLTVEPYHAMNRAGIFLDGEPVELLDGWLIRKTRKDSPHTTSLRLTRAGLEPVLPPCWFIIYRDPITLAESETEPDAVVVRGALLDYAERHPGPDEVALVVEVADSSLHGDRTWKMRIYARAGIRHYWIIDLVDRLIETHADPDPESSQYRLVRAYAVGESLPLVIDGRVVVEVAADNLLPPI